MWRMKHADVKAATGRWELTIRRSIMLCRNGRIESTKKEYRVWDNSI